MNGWSWLRVLVPSWRFFDSVSAPLALWVESEGAWRQLTLPHEYGLFCNPRGNLSLLLYSTLERLQAELAEDPDDPSELTSYALVRNLAAREARGDYRFELRDGEQMLLRSPLYTQAAP